MPKLPPALRQHTFDIPPEEGGLEPTPARRIITEHLRPIFAKLKPWTMAIDPGEVHAGMAWTRSQPALIGGETVGSRLASKTCTPDECTDAFGLWADAAHQSGTFDPVVVIEAYRIGPQELKMHLGSDVPTLQHIGALRYVARRYKIRVEMQQRDIKRPMAGILNGRAVKSLGDSRHSKDAELHLWYFCLRGQLPGLDK